MSKGSNDIIPIILVGVGAILLYAAIKDKSPITAVKDVLTGKSETPAPANGVSSGPAAPVSTTDLTQLIPGSNGQPPTLGVIPDGNVSPFLPLPHSNQPDLTTLIPGQNGSAPNFGVIPNGNVGNYLPLPSNPQGYGNY